MPKGGFFALPSGVKLDASVRFLLATLAPEARSFTASLDVGEIHVGLDPLLGLFEVLRAQRKERATEAEDILSGSDSEVIASPMMSPLLSPPTTPATGKSSPSRSARFRSIEALSVSDFVLFARLG
jgi:hypothetical protein